MFLQNVTFAAMKKHLHILLLLTLLLAPLQGRAQGHVRRAMERARAQQEAMARKEVNSERGNVGAGYLRMMVQDGDTIYLDTIKPTWITERGKHRSEKSWQNYYKLVWRFARVYPYAEEAGRLQRQIDSVIAAENMGMVRKDRLVGQVQKQLFRNFEGAFRQMSISQGALMMKLIDRESGKSSYSIIKEYKNGVAAGFWQAVAKLFDNDLKSQYDPEGADRDIEELVQIWKAGEFRELYWSLFWEEAPVIEIPEITIGKP